MGKKLLYIVFTGLWFLIFYRIVDYLVSFLPVNFVWDLLAIVILLIAFVASVALAEKTVSFILKHLQWKTQSF